MYGYSKLTGSEKKLYNTLLNGISSHKSSITITASSTDSVLRAYYAIIGDHPEIFYITGKLVFIGSKTLVSTVEVEYAYTASQTEQMNKEIEAVASAILSKISVNSSSFEKLKIIHDSIILGCDYSYTGSNLHNLYGALVEGKSVCEGYAEAFQYLAQRVGVMTLAVTGDVGVEGHMWNMVRLENEFYHIDPTHDDPTGSEKDYIQYDYFNLTTAEILQTRTISPYYDSATKSWLNYYEIPNSTATKYNYFNYKGLNFSSYDSVAALSLQNEISNAVLAGRRDVFIRFSSADAYTAAFNSLNKNGEVFTLIDNATADMPTFSLKGVYTSGEQSDFNIMWIYLNY